jgi:hypothetical protein
MAASHPAAKAATGPGHRLYRTHADGQPIPVVELETERLLLEDSLHERGGLLELELASARPLGLIRGIDRPLDVRDRLTSVIGQGGSKWLHGRTPLIEL